MAKIFCISYQRTGTTSVGRFFHDHGRRVATYKVNRKNGWTEAWFEGRYKDIFQSQAFADHDMFEDDPWWCLDFYKVLFHRFPRAKFVHFERDADKWFDSMIRHSGGRTLGNTFLHSHLYRREAEFETLPPEQQQASIYSSKLDMLLPLTEQHRAHYTAIYRARNAEIRTYFQRFGPERLFRGKLEDPDKWTKLGKFAGLAVTEDYDAHEHKAKEARARA